MTELKILDLRIYKNRKEKRKRDTEIKKEFNSFFFQFFKSFHFF